MILAMLLMGKGMPAQGASPFDPFGVARIDQRPGAQVPLDGPFQDQSGENVTLRGLAAGKVLVVVPVLHDCPNICGVTLAGITSAAARQTKFKAGRDFVIVAFGIDPNEAQTDARSNLERLRKQVPEGEVQPVATVGSAVHIHAVTDALGYHYAFDPRIGQYAHAAASAVLTPEGKLVRWLYGLDPTPQELADALDKAKAGQTGGFVQQLILLCYHYDPKTGTYSLLIDRVMRFAGIATVLGIAGLILWLRRRKA
ncbi:SCO family protein [Novosphingobium sp. PY1]|uniref:SCO family protein n=1 Tax=Novosphingobium sp. PY1 TaxID=1882221 RepID=UPI001A8D4B6F|nr:SCO family protein [Novosphingobium sp. PY1]